MVASGADGQGSVAGAAVLWAGGGLSGAADGRRLLSGGRVSPQFWQNISPATFSIPQAGQANALGG
jgi:hypothetical protein